MTPGKPLSDFRSSSRSRPGQQVRLAVAQAQLSSSTFRDPNDGQVLPADVDVLPAGAALDA